MNTNKYQFQINTNFKYVFNWVFVLICTYLYLFGISMGAIAQEAISLSVSPPIFEIIIAPGKEYKTEFNISNQGGKTSLTPKIVYFVPSDNLGNVKLTDLPSPEWVKFDNQPFTLESGNSKNITVTISPPHNLDEVDHYLSLVFVTNSPADLLNDNSSFYTAKIASNILLTISKDGNPKKSAEIVEFSAPKVVDSLLGKISYLVKLKNTGNSYWKPIGKIVVNDKDILNIAPQNIISGSSRDIYCIENENLTSCKLDKNILLGKYNAELEFRLDENTKVHSQQTTTYAFPFVMVGFITILIFGTLLTIRYKRHHS